MHINKASIPILSLRIKKIIKVILSSTTRIRLIIYIEDPKEAPSIDYVYIKKDTKVEETTIAVTE